MSTDVGQLRSLLGQTLNAANYSAVGAATSAEILAQMQALLATYGFYPVVETVTGGNLTVAAATTLVVLNKPSLENTGIIIPALAARQVGNLLVPLSISDFSGWGGTVSITTADDALIMGMLPSTQPWVFGPGAGPGSGGALTMWPIPSVGWIVT